LAQELRQRGYQAWALQGGYDAWKDAGLPLGKKSKAA
jgi:rhodanese-related sulfurtransferase